MKQLIVWLVRVMLALAATGAVTPSLAAPDQIGVFRNGHWYLDANGNGVWDGTPDDIHIVFGAPGDLPVVGDWNGDGKSKVGVFRNGYWFLDYNGNGLWDGEFIDRRIAFGKAGDLPVAGDWNGSGFSKIGLFRRFHRHRASDWWIDYNGNGVWDAGDLYYNHGSVSSVPVIGDWTGDGKSKQGWYWTQEGYGANWWLDTGGNGAGLPDLFPKYGMDGDVPVTGDWNGDAVTNIGVFRNGVWILDRNGNLVWDGEPTDLILRFGVTGDTPVVGKRWR